MTGPNRCIYTDEYCDGWLAHARGAAVSENPYAVAEGAPNPWHHKAYNWRAGWFEAERVALVGEMEGATCER
ncbi:hypothetical protein UFOVP469_29 [uncultured Caudovirales phage]|uniref:Uncharacterized protein n=1 Tax=uncultured Caudovirales phage TaxID=2100421 RepID=A0A6J5QYM8_9CAUD|nr:hypothetical protein UFOVP469_29 [uncultured Caudovirales phage]CAB4189523.1 hypothetical protein UFOVP1200_2 [uncultured Caudovirales phage]